MRKMFGQLQVSLNFYFYGKSHFTSTGYATNAALYSLPTFHDTARLDDKVVLITGANAGIGKEMAKYAAKTGASVFMVCRTLSKAETAKEEIVKETGNSKVHVLQCDVSLEADVRRCWNEFESHESFKGKSPELHALVTNAGALLNEKTLTSEGVETTFAAHLLYGTHLLGKLAMPTLERTIDSRLIMVSSGGMYNTKLPGWEIMASTHEKSDEKYDGNLAYAYAKRGQVVLAEKWARDHPAVKVVSTHPGWTLTEGVESAYGDKKSWLEPLRSIWEGAEGICWLMSVGSAKIESGAFYLDREPQPKHIAGNFYYEGTATKNSPEEIDKFLENLERANDNSKALHSVWRGLAKVSAEKLAARATPGAPSAVAIDLMRFMQNWHVLATQPIEAVSEHLSSNGLEQYSWDEERNLVAVKFHSSPLDKPVEEIQEARMHGYVQNSPINTSWTLNIKLGFYLPTGLKYYLLHVAEDLSWCLVGVPSRANFWIMTTKRPMNKFPVPLPSNVEFHDEDIVPFPPSDDVLTAEQEADIMKQGLVMVEKLGWDISETRIGGWRGQPKEVIQPKE